MSDRVIPFSAAANAYGPSAAQPLRIRPVAKPQPTAPLQRDTLDISAAARAQATPSHPLAAARVPGHVSFDGVASAQAQGALPIYTNPADRNTAATGIDAGRLIDVRG